MEEGNAAERFVGVDFHTQEFVVTRLRGDGSRAGRTEHHASTRAGIEAFLRSCGPEDHVVVEATYHWALFAEVFEEFEGELVLAHPYKNRLIAESRNKNDRVDSKVLADLLRTNFLARAWIAPREVREGRELLRYRFGLVRLRTCLKNRIRALLAKAGQGVAARDLFSEAGLRELEALKLGETRELVLRNAAAVARCLRECVEELEAEITKRVKLSAEARLVDSIRGFGPLSALTVVLEIGDIGRFSSAKKLVSYAGLAPVNRESGGVLRHGPLSKQGSPWLRWILMETVSHAVEAYPSLAELYLRVSRNQGHRKNPGRIAVARQLLVSIYHMLKRKEPFRWKRIGACAAQP